ncbi:amino acid permease/ SLC12A domain-containing protein [Umbelopsis sp. PMI_123]|nr:amino acid permease/ SLC12A domain-containing protein [Umbelopsis sp. PMI_123]
MTEQHVIESSYASQDLNEQYTPSYDEKVQVEEQEDQSQEQNQVQNAGNGELKRNLKTRHLQMIAIGGTIGTGIFLSSGSAVADAGPAGALIAYVVVGIMVFFVVTSLGEMSAYLPVAGAFTTFGARFVDPALGFTLGWNYWLQWAISIPTEVVAAGVIIDYWAPNLASWIPALVFIVVLVGINLIGVRVYGEMEYWFALIKVITCILFIFVGIFVDTGVAGGNKIGVSNWYIDGAPFPNGALAVFTTCLSAFFSFGGTEMVGITAGESSNPRKAVPRAISQVFWRILLFYILSILIIGLVIPYDDPSLLDAAYGDLNSAVKVAPFTKVFQMANWPGADHAVNAVLLTSVLSAGNSCFYACTRTLMALGREGKAPRIFGKVNSWGVPVYALAVTTFFACLAFLADIFGSSTVFTWLINLTGLSALLTWMCISIIHLRFRRAFKVQGRDIKDLPYRAPLFPYGCYVAILLCLVVLVADIYYAASTTPFDPVNIVGVIIGLPFFLIFYVGWKIVKRTKFVDPADADLDTDRAVIVDEEEEGKGGNQWWQKALSYLA